MPQSQQSPVDLLIVGAGGHGAVVLDIVRAAGFHRPVGFIDADPALVGKMIDDVPVLGPFNLIQKLKPTIRYAIVAIGDNRARRSYAGKLAAAGFELVNAIHPRAHVSVSAALGRNIVMAAG